MLKRTEVFSKDIVGKRADELQKIMSNLCEKLQRITATDSQDGVVLEESNIASKLAAMSSDDVARARAMVDCKEIQTDVPGITSSLYCNPSLCNGDLPALQAMLSKLIIDTQQKQIDCYWVWRRFFHSIDNWVDISRQICNSDNKSYVYGNEYDERFSTSTSTQPL